MLLPDERARAIELLVNFYISKFAYGNNFGAVSLSTIFRNGFTGFGSMGDRELLRAMRQLKEHSHDISMFLNNVMDGYLLEDKGV